VWYVECITKGAVTGQFLSRCGSILSTRKAVFLCFGKEVSVRGLSPHRDSEKLPLKTVVHSAVLERKAECLVEE